MLLGGSSFNLFCYFNVFVQQTRHSRNGSSHLSTETRFVPKKAIKTKETLCEQQSTEISLMRLSLFGCTNRGSERIKERRKCPRRWKSKIFRWRQTERKTLYCTVNPSPTSPPATTKRIGMAIIITII